LLKNVWNKYAKLENFTGHAAPPPTKIDRHAATYTMTPAHASRAYWWI